MDEIFPRVLTERERELLSWVLPAERPGYLIYRELLQWKVAGQGRRGAGNYILAADGELVDNESPLPQVLAYGQVETSRGAIAVTVRERLGNQVEFEIAALGPLSNTAEEVRRWTYSTWGPDGNCPICDGGIRQVRMNLASGRMLVLAICRTDKKLWIFDSETGINHPIPVTNFYNELMMHKNIRDPQKALDSKRLFEDLPSYTDHDLVHAFRTYNQVRTKVHTEEQIQPEKEQSPTFFKRVLLVFGDRPAQS